METKTASHCPPLLTAGVQPVPLENSRISEPTRIILVFEFILRCLFLSPYCSPHWGSAVRSRAELQLENLALRQQINVLRRSLKKRPKLSSGDRLFGVSLSRLWRDWPSTLVIVKPETVVAWHLQRLPAILDLEGSTRAARSTWHSRRDPRPDPQDVPRESQLGCTAHSRRAAQAGHRYRRD